LQKETNELITTTSNQENPRRYFLSGIVAKKEGTKSPDAIVVLSLPNTGERWSIYDQAVVKIQKE